MASKSTVRNDHRMLVRGTMELTVVESRAICRYLEAKYKGKGTELIPSSDVKALGLFEQAAYIESSNFDPFASVMVFERAFKK